MPIVEEAPDRGPGRTRRASAASLDRKARPRGTLVTTFFAAIALAATALLGGCTSGASTTASPAAPSPAASPSASPAASPSVAALPTTLVGTWAGSEYDANSGETWETTYRIGPCRQYDKPWKAPADDQLCGEWTGDATIEGLPAHCTATLLWLKSDGDAFKFLASNTEGSSKYRTIPHPYLKIDDTWYCWDTFRATLTPGASETMAVETIGAGALAGAFAATEGTVARGAP